MNVPPPQQTKAYQEGYRDGWQDYLDEMARADETTGEKEARRMTALELAGYKPPYSPEEESDYWLGFAHGRHEARMTAGKEE